jgi:hypothetical protein
MREVGGESGDDTEAERLKFMFPPSASSSCRAIRPEQARPTVSSARKVTSRTASIDPNRSLSVVTSITGSPVSIDQKGRAADVTD